ncbi:hypothetical protein [Mangrovibacterium diazotrophicum]|uniref:Uncharacterized protein n=1 Tax=Mangrovibacterium diazotrophicum TaxID=1261403 RepID=A0A419WBI5_9BACT|nr:hypothetical protein [Mangrovibacterium diazotrophicum]RKD92809.1 hypothetical protein BC643_3186 [Mangrovibacterium diazotrophicum]
MKDKNSSGLQFCVLLVGTLIIMALTVSCDMTENDDLASDNTTESALKSKSFLPEFPGAAAFVDGFTNPYLAFDEGKVFHYEGETEDGTETIVVTVTSDTKEIYGVMATVVSDIAYLDGEMVEKTEDWYAEDLEGNVWYFGEYSEEYEDGELVGTEGSWEAGVEGALPGVLMFANPEMGMKYQQEYLEDEAEDMAIVINLNKTVEIDYGTFEGCLETMEWSPLEPGAREHKFYKKGVGLIQELQPGGGRSTVDLVSVEMP